MANLYESENFNIVSVHTHLGREDYDDGSYYEDSCLIVKVQRLPLDLYPEITTVFILSDTLSSSVTLEQFLEAAPSIIVEELSSLDSSYDGSETTEFSTEGLPQKFTD